VTNRFGVDVVNAPVVFMFGSRSGSVFALVLFGSLFAALGWSIARAIVQKGGSPRMARLAGGLLFLVPLAFVYMSSLSGFYEAEIGDGRVVLRYLHPWSASYALNERAAIDTRPAFRSRWRLHINVLGRAYESATSSRIAVDRAAAVLAAAGPPPDNRVR
jgi:hypothetical protein